MIYALLGDIIIGDAVWTGPTSAKETQKATLVELNVAYGKKPIQDMGDENDAKSLEFFFDETFCDCQTELAKLQTAFATRLPLALVAGDGAFNGVRWLVESLDVTTLKTTPYGRPVRMKVSVSLIEAPLGNMFNFLASLARGAASAIRRSGTPSVGTRSK